MTAEEIATDLVNNLSMPWRSRDLRERIAKAIAAEREKAEAERAEARNTALNEAADVADQWTQPGTPTDSCWLAIGNELGKVRDAILALKERTL